MQTIERGSGTALVLVPGIQGRWEYQRSTVDALASSFRVVTMSLTGEPGRGRFDPSRGLDDEVAAIGAALDERRLDRAVICGVSFGGLAALRFAAAHPNRTEALVLASAPGPRWRLRRSHEIYVGLPWLFAPLFLIEATRRWAGEIAVTFPARRDRWGAVRRQVQTAMAAPVSASRMARRAAMIASLEIEKEARRVVAPTLIVTGEPALDYVVPVDGTTAYARLIPNATHVVLARTGHLGTVTRPHEFARIVREFLEQPQARTA